MNYVMLVSRQGEWIVSDYDPQIQSIPPTLPPYFLALNMTSHYISMLNTLYRLGGLSRGFADTHRQSQTRQMVPDSTQ